MQKRRLNKVTGYAILTKRTEINQVIPSGAPTYDDVIKESLQESQQRSAHLASQKRWVHRPYVYTYTCMCGTNVIITVWLQAV